MPVPRVSPVWIVPSEAVKKSPGRESGLQGCWHHLDIVPAEASRDASNLPLLAARLRRDTEGILSITDMKAL
jgi:hypothetical protein